MAAPKSLRAAVIPTMPASTIKQLERHANGKKRVVADTLLTLACMVAGALIFVVAALALTGADVSSDLDGPRPTPATYGYPMEGK